MALSAKLEFRQSQSLVMTPRLMQAIKLLHMSNMDLVSYVEAELERNPLLERDDTDGSGDSERERGQSDNARQTEAAPDTGSDGEPSAEAADWVDTTMSSTGGDMEAAFDSSLANVFPDEVPAKALDPDLLAGNTWSSAASGGPSGGEATQFEAAHAADISLSEHLSEQLALSV
ncbi:MAG: RNA polymerase sigma-54 factor, partial [Pseudomonadota bacterium]